ncbi:hypothetical protein MMC10_006239 [Thelotrema lepadinum]|nr:hypothetical protein [Thelotrema lepadinum]
MATSSKIRKFKHIFTPQNSSTIIPREVQTSLLHVGMRIRKSVGQGYKTELVIEEEKLRNERSILTSKPPHPRFRESSISIMEDDCIVDQNDFFPSSQDSLSSVSSQDTALSIPYTYPKQKRKWADGPEEDDLDDSFVDNQMETTSTCLRPLAQARSVRHSMLAQQRPPKDDAQKCSKDLDDFEEAIFLVPDDQRGASIHYTRDLDNY